MASSGKKGKKNKGKVISLQSFLANGDTPPGVTQVAKKVRSRGDESDDDDAPPQVYQIQLPTAPRASRMFDDDSVPHKPPFLAYITNLPFDIREEDIYEFFEATNIVSLRLPREDGENGRLRGFGYIEFETRDDLIYAIRLPDPHIRNRRVRIDVSNESEIQQRERRGGNRSRYDGFGNSSENRDSTNWRRGNDGGRDDDRRSGYGYNRDRQQRDGSQETGSWRTGDRPNLDSSPGRRGGGGGGGGGGGFGDRFGGRRGGYDENRRSEDVPQERPKLNLKPRTLPLPEIVTTTEEKEKSPAPEEEEVEERVPTPEPSKPKPSGVSAEKVFGGAKPVDTAAREKEIEERLERERQEKLRLIEEKEEKERETEINEKEIEQHTEKDEKENRNTISWRRRDDDYKSDENRKYSPDRRPPPQRRNDDRRGNRDGGRDRRGDYNRGGFDRENRMRDNRDRNDRNDRNDRSDRDYHRGDRDRDRGYNKDNKNYSRDNKHKDDKPKRENRPEKPMPKYQPQQSSGPVLSSSNKYSVFLDKDDVSE